MTNLIPTARSAWFSSSVPKSKLDIWVNQSGGRVEPDPFEADFLFAENSECSDLKRIFKSKEYLEGHLTVFHSDYIPSVVQRKIVNNMDLKTLLIIPWKEFEEHGISLVPCLGNNRSAHITHHSSDSEFSTTSNFNRKSAPSSSENDTVSQKHAAQSEVPRNVGTIEKKSSWKCMDGRSLDEWMSGFRPTQSTTSLKETSRPKNTNSTNDLSFAARPITHLNELTVPRAKLMDFEIGENGCYVEKIGTKLSRKNFRFV